MLSVESRRRAVKRLWSASIDRRGRPVPDLDELTAAEILETIPADPEDLTAHRRSLLAGPAYRLKGFRRSKAVYR